MKDKEYILLKNMLRTNKQFLNSGDIEFIEYLENHRAIMAKIKSSIIKMEDDEFNIIKIALSKDSIHDFKKGMLLIKQNFN